MVNFINMWEAGLYRTSDTRYGIVWSDSIEEGVDQQGLVNDWTGTQGIETIQVSYDSTGGRELCERLIYSNSNQVHSYQTQVGE